MLHYYYHGSADGGHTAALTAFLSEETVNMVAKPSLELNSDRYFLELSC
jgi:hypothetical protein